MNEKIQIFSLPKILDERGNLSFIESNQHIPFKIKRVYWIYDIPGGAIRGSHALKNTDEIIIALSGGFNVLLHDGIKEYTYCLTRANEALFVPRGIWRTLNDFTTNGVALVIASEEFSEEEYIRDFDTYKEYKANEGKIYN